MEQVKSRFSGWRVVFHRKVEGRVVHTPSKQYFASKEDAIKWLFSPSCAKCVVEHASEFDGAYPITFAYSR